MKNFTNREKTMMFFLILLLLTLGLCEKFKHDRIQYYANIVQKQNQMCTDMYKTIVKEWYSSKKITKEQYENITTKLDRGLKESQLYWKKQL